jgi:lactam utilization protein B
LFDFNCDLTENFSKEIETAKYASSINIASGLFESNPASVKAAVDFALENEKALGALICWDKKIPFTPENIEAYIIYQVGAISAYSKAFGLELENVRLDRIISEQLSDNPEIAKNIMRSIQKINPWLTLILNNYEIKEILENELDAKCALEVEFGDKSSIRELREMQYIPQTIHFTSEQNIKRAYDVIKPAPINYNRVCKELE